MFHTPPKAPTEETNIVETSTKTSPEETINRTSFEAAQAFFDNHIDAIIYRIPKLNQPNTIKVLSSPEHYSPEEQKDDEIVVIPDKDGLSIKIKSPIDYESPSIRTKKAAGKTLNNLLAMYPPPVEGNTENSIIYRVSQDDYDALNKMLELTPFDFRGNYIKTVDGNIYRCDSLLGQGSNAKLYQGVTKNNETIKFKIFNNTDNNDEYAKNEHLFETMLGRSPSPITSYTDLSSRITYTILVTRYAEGENLSTYLSKLDEPLTAKTAMLMCYQLLGQVKSFFGFDLAHGDIKLENMIFKLDHPENSTLTIIDGDQARNEIHKLADKDGGTAINQLPHIYPLTYHEKDIIAMLRCLLRNNLYLTDQKTSSRYDKKSTYAIRALQNEEKGILNYVIQDPAILAIANTLLDSSGLDQYSKPMLLHSIKKSICFDLSIIEHRLKAIEILISDHPCLGRLIAAGLRHAIKHHKNIFIEAYIENIESHEKHTKKTLLQACRNITSGVKDKIKAIKENPYFYAAILHEKIDEADLKKCLSSTNPTRYRIQTATAFFSQKIYDETRKKYDEDCKSRLTEELQDMGFIP